jgi:SAM-dependent methyltransferase
MAGFYGRMSSDRRHPSRRDAFSARLTVVGDFLAFVLDQLPPAPGRVLEIGCGKEGGLVATLGTAGYDVLGVDPEAPDGQGFLRARFQDVGGEYDAVVAGRVLHHVQPLDEGIAKLASLAPLLVVDEFARERVDPAARDWYEGQRRMLVAAGMSPPGPPDLGAWAARHPDLHDPQTLLAALRTHYDERTLEWVPYLHRWLEGPSSEELESALVSAGAIPAIGYRWAGTTRASR